MQSNTKPNNSLSTRSNLVVDHSNSKILEKPLLIANEAPCDQVPLIHLLNKDNVSLQGTIEKISNPEYSISTLAPQSASTVHYCCHQPKRVFLFILLIIVFFFIVILFASFERHKVAYSVPNFALLCGSFFSHKAPLLFELTHENISLEHYINLVLRDSDKSPELQISELLSLHTSSLSSSSDQNGNVDSQVPQSFHKCSHYSCFDIYRCGTPNFNPYQYPKHLKRKLIKVYVYPNYRYVNGTNNEPYHLSFSVEFSRMLAAIVSSPYYTNNPLEACLFIVNLDLLNFNLVDLSLVEQILWSLPHFNSGFNHLLFSMIFPPNNLYSHFGIEIGNSMVAAAGYNLHRYRSQFDIAIPMYSVFSQLYENEQLRLTNFNIDSITKLQRKWTLICTQTNLISLENLYYLKRMESIFSNRMLLLYLGCSVPKTRFIRSSIDHMFIKRNSTASRIYNETFFCNHDHKINIRYLDALHNSDFCIIIKSSPLDSPLLSDALMSGCIPVIISDTLVLPFEERIDWTSVGIRVWEHSTNELFDIINSISPKRIRHLRINGLHVWQKYFSSVENITRTTLDIINERVFPKPRKVFSYSLKHFTELTPLTLDYYSNGFNYITPKQVYLQTNGFTTVILSYNRVDSLFEVVMSVARVPSCVKIVVVWNNQNMRPPSKSKWPQISVPVQVILTEANKLSNRFYPYSSIETEAIFAIDDDITMLNSDEIEFAYQTWREFPDRIVGFPSRLHYWDNGTEKWYYNSEWKNEVSLILTGAAFYHKVSSEFV